MSMCLTLAGPSAGGLSPSPTSWAVDATSGIAVPASSVEWSSFIAAKSLGISAPNSLWLCQDAAGNLADSIGSLPLAVTGAPTYQQSVSGWSRLGAAFQDGQSERFSLDLGTGPDPSTTSQVWLAVMATPAAPLANRVVMGINIGASSTARILHLSNGLLRMQAGGTNNDSANTYTSGVHILVLRFDRANSSAVFYTELEALPGTYNAGASDGSKGFGSTGASADAATYLYGAMWSGTAAESFSDANVRSLLQGLGWSVSW